MWILHTVKVWQGYILLGWPLYYDQIALQIDRGVSICVCMCVSLLEKGLSTGREAD